MIYLLDCAQSFLGRVRRRFLRSGVTEASAEARRRDGGVVVLSSPLLASDLCSLRCGISVAFSGSADGAIVKTPAGKVGGSLLPPAVSTSVASVLLFEAHWKSKISYFCSILLKLVQ